jgi:hypothetical protein
VAQIIAEAGENEDILTKTTVLNRIRSKFKIKRPKTRAWQPVVAFSEARW